LKSKRPKNTLESSLRASGFQFIAGVDEAGRGPLAGPVVASAVVLKKTSFKNRIDDSKKLSAAQRERAFREILQKAYVGVGIISESAIDEVNILNATLRAMERAVANLMQHRFKKVCFIVDGGNLKLNLHHPYRNIPKADSSCFSVACASIVAKVVRDKIMDAYDRIFPQYGFSQHKGYGTNLHFQRIKKFGPSIIHRRSFYPVSEYVQGK
jgi:ribonuclease HII